MTPELPHRDVIDTFRGYRSWHGCDSPDGVYLVGMTYATAWGPEWTTAECGAGSHEDNEAPKRGCNCGLYAWHLPDPLLQSDMFGVVEATERIILSAAGFKARKARIVAVFCKDEARFKRINESYPNTRVYRSRDLMLADFPPKTHATEVYGPFGVEAQRLMLQVENMTGSQAHDLDKAWATWGDATKEDYGSRVAAHVVAHEAVMGTRRQYGVRSTTRPVSQVVSWARMALFGGDMVDEKTYRLLMDPWAKAFGDPLEGVTRTPVGVVLGSGLHGPGGYHSEDS